jgi:PAS domain S-box-containing protein
VTTSTLTLLELQAAIIREPLVVPADATVMEAIALMSIGRSQCDAENYGDNHQQQFQQEARSSCVLVLEDEKLIGIVTERDVVRLSAQQQDLDRLLVREVMAHPVVTMRESDLTDLFLAVNLLQQYHIRHLPLLDDQYLLVGMVTHESLRQISRPIDLMRLRLVSEVMTSDVVCAAADCSMLAITQMMAEQKISSVMIVEPSRTDTSLQIPVGIVTERDVVQFQALGLNLETYVAHTIMSTPIFAVKPEDNLLTVQQIMEQRLIRRLAVTGEFGELLGIVTQTSLLQALNPTEIYNLAKVLEAKVEQLESEKVTLLENRNVDLESQVKERTASLLEAEKALQQLNQSLEAKVQERTQEVQLQAQMLEQIHDAIISTALDGTILTWNIGAEILYEYKSDEAIGQNVSMLYLNEDLPLMESEVFSPLIEKGIHEVELQNRTKSGNIIYISLRLSIARDAIGNIRLIGCSNNISDRKQAEKALKESEHSYASLMAAAPVGIFRTDAMGYCTYVNERWCSISGLTLESALGDGWRQGLYSEDRQAISDEWYRSAQEDRPFSLEYRFQRPDGVVTWVYGQSVTKLDVDGIITGYVGTITDINDRKQAEKALKESERLFSTLVSTSPVVITRFDLSPLNCIYVNERWSEMTGRPAASAMGRGWIDAVHPDERDMIIGLTEHEFFSPSSRQFMLTGEGRHLRPDGTINWYFSQLVKEYNESGEVTGYIGTLTDISDRKQAEQVILQQANRETLLRGITQRIRQSLDLSIIFDTACQEIRQLLQCDRVGIFKLYPESNFDDGEFVAESVVDGFSSAMEVHIHDHCFGENYAAAYVQGRIQVVNDIDNAGLTDCHRDILAQFQVRANLVIPLLCGNNLWGLLCIHQCAHTRQWQEHEVNLIQEIAGQLAIAIQQTSLYQQLQEELLIRQQSQLKIAQQLRQQQTLATITNKIRESLSLKEILAVVTQQVKDVLFGDRAIVFQLFDNGNSQIVEESVHSNFPNLKDLNWENEVWSQEILNCYWQGKPRIVPDVMNDIWTECLVEYSIEGQIKSKIIAPILLEAHNSENHRWVATDGYKKLWGVLVVHACAEPREWQDSEAQLLQQIANQLAIAIQQASLYEQSQQEIVERKQAQQQLTETNQQLARATRLKDEFLANMSHELRTPLNSILGMNEALQEGIFGSINERQLKTLQTIENSSTHLLALINDILDVAKIESGEVMLELTATDLDSLCKSSMAFIKQQALTKRIQLIPRIPKHLPEIMLDERRIRQVLINLLNNAVKFTLEGGTITLEVSQVQLESSPTNLTPLNYIKIAVIDTGIGISSENIQKLFQPFIQIDSALNRQYQGTGLGLALVKRLVELHGGTVELTSEVGVGSCFAINLPINIGDPAIEEQTEDLSGQSQISQSQTEAISPLILLAEDNEANIATFSSYLDAKGYRILLANDGQQAIDLAKSHSPDLILMDIQMPVIDGMEAIKQIRLDPNLVNIPIIALTALAMAGDREKCLAAGANEYLSKPIKLKALADTIQNILKNRN